MFGHPLAQSQDNGEQPGPMAADLSAGEAKAFEAGPRVSVVISVHNRAAMLLDCFRGLAGQTMPRGSVEVVVVDNCSTEDLGPTLEQGRALGLDLRAARTAEDRGPAPARNMGVAMARGTVIAFTDSDCRPTPNWLAAALPCFDDPAVAFVGGPVLPKPEQKVNFTSRATFITPEEHPTFPTANLLVRRDIFLAHGGFDASLSFTDPFARATECADTDLAWRIIEAGHAREFAAEAVMEHEVETQPLWLWMIDPSRLFVLPALISRHPGLRPKLLTWNLFFYPPAATLYLAVPFALVTASTVPWLLWLLPLALLGRSAVRTRSLNPLVLLRQSLRVLAHFPRMVVMNGALIYGSVRFRCLVL